MDREIPGRRGQLCQDRVGPALCQPQIPGQSTITDCRLLNSLTAGAEYIGVFTHLLPHSVTPYKHVKAIM